MKRMFIDAAHTEEVRIVIAENNRIEDFEAETAGKAQLKGNIYIGHVSRVEPSLQAAFITYGGNRNGFLAFGEVHPQYFHLKKDEKTALLEELTQAALRRRGRDAEDGDSDGAPLDASAMANAMEAADPAESPTEDTPTHLADMAPEEMPAATSGATPVPELLEHAPGEVNGNLAEGSTGARPVRGRERHRKPPFRDEPRGRPRRASEAAPVEADTVNGSGSAAQGNSHTNGHADDKPARQVAIHRRYRIQDVLKEGQKILVQVVKEERGSKGAALTTYFSMPGRYTVLMPNTPAAGGISRKITDGDDRRALRDAYAALEIPPTMGLIIRTAGTGQPPEAITRDYQNLKNLWEKISTDFEAGDDIQCLHEDGSVIIRALRDMMSDDIEDIVISGKRAVKLAKDYTRTLMPEAAALIKEHKEDTPLLTHYKLESKLSSLHHTRVTLPSGGYMIINPTEALVSVDINSGRATQERNIEETALKTNLEACEELARQIRLRDLAGLIVVDFIDMESGSNNRKVENAMRKALRRDRARIQCGHISDFGLMEISRQRLRPSFGESHFIACPHCQGSGLIHAPSTAALMILRRLEEDDCRGADRIIVTTSTEQVLWLLNHKRDAVRELEAKWKYQLVFRADDALIAPDHKLDLIRLKSDGSEATQTIPVILREQPELPPEQRVYQKARRRDEDERPERPERPERGARPERADKPEREARQEREQVREQTRETRRERPARTVDAPQRPGRPQRIGTEAAQPATDTTEAVSERGNRPRRGRGPRQDNSVDAATAAAPATVATEPLLIEPITGKPNRAAPRSKPVPAPLPVPVPLPVEDQPLKVETMAISDDDTPVVKAGPRKAFEIRKRADTDAADAPIAVENRTPDSMAAAPAPTRTSRAKAPARSKPAATVPPDAEPASALADSLASSPASSPSETDSTEPKKGSILARLIGRQ